MLKSCPFCKGKAQISYENLDERMGYNVRVTIYCIGCNASMSTMSNSDKNGWCNEDIDLVETRAINKWNTRVSNK